METINTDFLIALVEERPVIWDKTLKLYKDKNLKISAWREICALLKTDFEEMEHNHRQDFGKLVLKKWTQIRDSWMKSVKKQKRQKKSGTSTKISRHYIFYDQMSFLNKIMTRSVVAQESEDSAYEEMRIEESEMMKNEGNHGEIKQSANKTSTEMQRKRKINEMDDKMMAFIDHQMNLSKNNEHENRHLSFFKSLLPSMSLLNEDQTLEFQAQVISLLQRIKRQKRHNRIMDNTIPNNN